MELFPFPSPHISEITHVDQTPGTLLLAPVPKTPGAENTTPGNALATQSLSLDTRTSIFPVTPRECQQAGMLPLWVATPLFSHTSSARSTRHSPNSRHVHVRGARACVVAVRRFEAKERKQGCKGNGCSDSGGSRRRKTNNGTDRQRQKHAGSGTRRVSCGISTDGEARGPQSLPIPYACETYPYKQTKIPNP